MKTTTNINRIDIITFIAVIILFAMMMPLNASTGKNTNASLNEVQAASSHLAQFNNEIERAVEFTAPSVSENFDMMVAETRLDELFNSVAQDIVYNSPVMEDNFETATAIENMENLNSEIENAVKYTASPVAE
jgi:hypothetical protein